MEVLSVWCKIQLIINLVSIFTTVISNDRMSLNFSKIRWSMQNLNWLDLPFIDQESFLFSQTKKFFIVRWHDIWENVQKTINNNQDLEINYSWKSGFLAITWKKIFYFNVSIFPIYAFFMIWNLTLYRQEKLWLTCSHCKYHYFWMKLFIAFND